MNPLDVLNLCSPLVFVVYVQFLKLIPPCPSSELMKTCRKWHNIFMSLLSTFMFFFALLAFATKNTIFNPTPSEFHKHVCHEWTQSVELDIAVLTFVGSKWVEMIDTLFLRLSGKPISKLHYFHHMTTCLLAWTNAYRVVGDFIPRSLTFSGVKYWYNTSYTVYHPNPGCWPAHAYNCMIHVVMYAHFAYPKGMFNRYRIIITQTQIFQHMLMIFVFGYAYVRQSKYGDCPQNNYSVEFALGLYAMYFYDFLIFYIKSYKKKPAAKTN